MLLRADRIVTPCMGVAMPVGGTGRIECLVVQAEAIVGMGQRVQQRGRQCRVLPCDRAGLLEFEQAWVLRLRRRIQMQQTCAGLQLQRPCPGVAGRTGEQSAIGGDRLVACAQLFVQVAQIEQGRGVVRPTLQCQVELLQRGRILVEMVAQQRGAIEMDLFRQCSAVLQCLRVRIQRSGCFAGPAQQISQVVPGIGAAGRACRMAR